MSDTRIVYYSTTQAARLLGVPRTNIHYWIGTGQLEPCAQVTRTGGRCHYMWTDAGLARIAELAGIETTTGSAHT